MAISEACPTTGSRCLYREHLNRVLSAVQFAAAETDFTTLSKGKQRALHQHFDGVAATINAADQSDTANACEYIGMCGIVAELTSVELVKNEELGVVPNANFRFRSDDL